MKSAKWCVIAKSESQSLLFFFFLSSEKQIKEKKNSTRIMSSFWKNKTRTWFKWDILWGTIYHFDLNKCIKYCERCNYVLGCASKNRGTHNNWINVIAIFELMSTDIKFQAFSLYLVYDPSYQMFYCDAFYFEFRKFTNATPNKD